MKNMIQLSICFLLVMLLIPVPLALAKGSPDMITITGPGLAAPIKITDPEILQEFNPRDGQFLEKSRETVTSASKTNALYTVLFYSKDKSGELQMFYAFKYSPASSGTRGEIYLPQETDVWYVMNNETIARRSGWLYASTTWDTVMERLLKGQQVSASTSTAWNSILLIILLIVGAVIFGSLQYRRKMPA